MRLLLDTHSLLWWWFSPEKLSTTAMRLLKDEEHEVFVSAASAWELATKARLGKLNIPQVLERFDELLELDGFLHGPVNWRHALRAGRYEQAHRDPFDRMLAAQAELDDLGLISRDEAFAAFPVRVVW